VAILLLGFCNSSTLGSFPKTSIEVKYAIKKSNKNGSHTKTHIHTGEKGRDELFFFDVIIYLCVQM
jgi:hypothetical protein